MNAIKYQSQVGIDEVTWLTFQAVSPPPTNNKSAGIPKTKSITIPEITIPFLFILYFILFEFVNLVEYEVGGVFQ